MRPAAFHAYDRPDLNLSRKHNLARQDILKPSATDEGASRFEGPSEAVFARPQFLCAYNLIYNRTLDCDRQLFKIDVVPTQAGQFPAS